MSDSAEFTVLDLFSGIGGFALATEWAGGRTVAFAEIAEYPSRVLAHHWPGVLNLGDVTKLCRRIYDCEQQDDTGVAWCPRCDADFGAGAPGRSRVVGWHCKGVAMSESHEECQFHNVCGGWCETEREIECNLCEFCLDAEREREAELEAHRELSIAFQRIAEAAGITSTLPHEVADIVCAMLFAGRKTQTRRLKNTKDARSRRSPARPCSTFMVSLEIKMTRKGSRKSRTVTHKIPLPEDDALRLYRELSKEVESIWKTTCW